MKLASMSNTGEQQECLSPATAQQLLATGGQLVDVRHPSDYEAGTLPGAMNLPLEAVLHARAVVQPGSTYVGRFGLFTYLSYRAALSGR